MKNTQIQFNQKLIIKKEIYRHAQLLQKIIKNYMYIKKKGQ